jgi:putative endonuclease
MSDAARVLSPEARILAMQRRARKKRLAKIRADDRQGASVSVPRGRTSPDASTKAKVQPKTQDDTAIDPAQVFTRSAIDATGRELAYQSPTQRDGAAQETLALAHLEAAGLQLLARNVASRVGELDLVMQDGDVLVFVEVRSRTSSRFGGAAASVTFAKQRRLERAAQVFLKNAWRGPLPRCRFDVVAISPAGIDWLRDAFTPGYT